MGRHEHRYWDGERWTDHVADAGQVSTDPLHGDASATGAAQTASPASDDTGDQISRDVAADEATSRDDTPQTDAHDVAEVGLAGDPSGQRAAEAAGATPGDGPAGSTPASAEEDQASNSPGARAADTDVPGTAAATTPETASGAGQAGAVPHPTPSTGYAAPVHGAPDQTSHGPAGQPAQVPHGQAGLPSHAPQSPSGGPVQGYQQPDQSQPHQSPGYQQGYQSQPYQSPGHPQGHQGQPYQSPGYQPDQGHPGQAGFQAAHAHPAPAVGASATQTSDKPGTSGLAITALIFAIIAVLTFWLPIAGGVIALLAVILGFIGRSGARRKNRGGAGMGLTAIILGILSLLANIVITVLVLWLFNSGSGLVTTFSDYEQCMNEINDTAICEERLLDDLPGWLRRLDSSS